MGILSFFDAGWRFVLAAVLALTPGILVWSLVLGIGEVVHRVADRRRQTSPDRRPVLS